MKDAEIKALLAEHTRSQTVTNNLNNPWLIGVLLISVLGYVYFQQQENQDAALRKVSATVESEKLENKAQTEAMTKLTGAVDQIVKDVSKMENSNSLLSKTLTDSTKDRFTNQDGANQRDLIRDIKSSIESQIATDKAELKGELQILQNKVDDISNEFATFKGRLNQ